MVRAISTSWGTVYGAALNDAELLRSLSDEFKKPPYKAPPLAPVLFIKPRNCLSFGGAAVPLPADLTSVRVAATVAVFFSRDLTKAKPKDVKSAIGAACLALDVSELGSNFFRPAVRQQCRDGFLPLSSFVDLPNELAEVITSIDGREAHRWSLSRLARSVEVLCSEISSFMTLKSGDLLLLGLPGDAPVATVGQSIEVSSAHFASLRTSIVAESTL